MYRARARIATWISKFLLEFLFGRKGGTGGFLGWDCIFFFPSGYLGNRNFLGWIWLESTLVNNLIDLSAYCVFFQHFFFLRQNRVFIGDSAFDWRSWFTESTVLLGVPRIRELSTKNQKQEKSLLAFSLSSSRTGLISSLSTTPPVSCHHQPPMRSASPPQPYATSGFVSHDLTIYSAVYSAIDSVTYSAF